MSLRDLQAANAALLRSTAFYGEAITLFDPVTDPATQTSFNGILEILPSDPLVHSQEADEVIEQATIDAPMTLAIHPRCWFEARGVVWKISGLGGRDRDLQTINVQRPIQLSKKSARRRGS